MVARVDATQRRTPATLRQEPMRTYRFVVDGIPYEVIVSHFGVDSATVAVNGVEYQVSLQEGFSAGSVVSALACQPDAPMPAASPATTGAPAMLAAALPADQTATSVTSSPAAPAEGTIVAPMPGLILEVLVSVGDQVQAGDAVVRMEAMKMENNISATTPGVVGKIHVDSGAEVQQGQALLTVE